MPANGEGIRRIVAGGAAPDARRRMVASMIKVGRVGRALAARDVAGFTAIGPDFSTQPEAYAEARVPSLVAGIDGETATVLQGIVQQGLDDGIGPDVLATRIEQQFTDWTAPAPGKQSRAERIARTEVAEVLNQSQLSLYRDSGVTHVLVHDGTKDGICDEANGQTWTIADAELAALGHPNCGRWFEPIPPVGP